MKFPENKKRSNRPTNHANDGKFGVYGQMVQTTSGVQNSANDGDQIMEQTTP